jgi:hypothetical protein
MASTVRRNTTRTFDGDEETERLAKRLKQQHEFLDADAEDTIPEFTAVPSHPLDVKPSGNALTANLNLKLAGGLLSSLPDELLMQLLEYLDQDSLVALGSTSKALYAFCRADELWKDLFIR